MKTYQVPIGDLGSGYVFDGDLLAGIQAVPISSVYGEQIPDVSYTVRRGDSLSVIADRYNTSVSELVAIR